MKEEAREEAGRGEREEAGEGAGERAGRGAREEREGAREGAREEAVEEEEPEPYYCVNCDCEDANVRVGFAGYSEDKKLDAVKWFYVGVRCARCGTRSAA